MCFAKFKTQTVERIKLFSYQFRTLFIAHLQEEIETY